MSKGKVTSLPPATGKNFRASDYVRPGLTEEEVLEIIAAFDLFDTDQGGSVDTKGIPFIIQNLKPLWFPSVLIPRTL